MNIEPVTELHKPAYPIVAAALAATLLTACDRNNNRFQITSGLYRSETRESPTNPWNTSSSPVYYGINNSEAYVPTPSIRDNPE